jgi:excisionase family DNA binding protein
MADREFLTIKEAAAIARVHVETFYRLIRRRPRSAPPFCRVRRAIRIPAVEFHEWMRRRK